MPGDNDPKKSPGPGYHWSGLQGTWVKGKTKMGRKPKNVGYLADKYPTGWQPKSSIQTENEQRKSARKQQRRNRQNYAKARQSGIMSGMMQGNKNRQHAAAASIKSNASKGQSQRMANSSNDMRRAAFRKIVAEHPKGIDFAWLRSQDDSRRANQRKVGAK